MSANGSTDSSRPGDDGFEYQGTFYRWHVSSIGKDLMLIDRFSGLPVAEFFALVEDDFDRGRAPILLTLLATSIRAEHPDWSVERIARTVMELDLGDVHFIDSDEEEDPVPPTSAGEEQTPTGGDSPSPSRLLSSAPAPATSETSSATPG
jgi:hypothetical protein